VPQDSPSTLDISVNLLSGTYHGREWPPSPARLYQAILAGSRYRFRYGEAWESAFDDALLWLEAQPPPIIVGSRGHVGRPYLVFGPDNDADLWVRERINAGSGHPPKESLDPASLRSQIERRPTYVSGILHYLYENRGAPLQELAAMARSLLALGHGIDLASGDVRVIAEDELAALHGDRWEPDPGGDVQLFVPVKGWYRRLETNYQRWRMPASEREKRVDARRGTLLPSVRPVRYRDPLGQASRPFYAYSLQRLEDGRPYSVCWEDGMEVSAQLRHAASETLRSCAVDESFLRVYALGHGKGSDRDRRLSYVPLPSVGHRYVDGRVRRALVVGPRGSWDPRTKGLGSILEGARLSPPNGPPESCIVPIPPDDPVLRRYVGPSRVWSSVTPVILHGHDARRGRVDITRTRNLIEQALEQAGIGRAAKSYAYRNAPWWPGTGSARSVRVPSHLSSWPRYHLMIDMRRELRGPLLVGIGRHYGIGLFAARA
jgi:CRISPR-associated protein Csb2